jgi:hypothetical protein
MTNWYCVNQRWRCFGELPDEFIDISHSHSHTHLLYTRVSIVSLLTLRTVTELQFASLLHNRSFPLHIRRFNNKPGGWIFITPGFRLDNPGVNFNTWKSKLYAFKILAISDKLPNMLSSSRTCFVMCLCLWCTKFINDPIVYCYI